MSLIGKSIGVLDQGYVELQDVMGDDHAIVAAARVSFLGETKGDEQDKKLLFYLVKHRHTTPFEMVEFKFRVHAPLMVWWQWVRHRTQSYNAQSGRYTPFDENDFYIPASWRLQATSNKQGSDGFLNINSSTILDNYLKDLYEHTYSLYQCALEMGVAKEQARLFLPGFACYYTWVVKVDAHNLAHFLRLRMAQEAQYEIREYARAIWYNFFKPALPWFSEALVEYGMINE